MTTLFTLVLIITQGNSKPAVTVTPGLTKEACAAIHDKVATIQNVDQLRMYGWCIETPVAADAGAKNDSSSQKKAYEP